MGAHNLTNVRLTDKEIILVVDGIEIVTSLAKLSSKLVNADQDERESFTISPSGYGIHWPLLDEDLSVDGIVKEAEVKYGRGK